MNKHDGVDWRILLTAMATLLGLGMATYAVRNMPIAFIIGSVTVISLCAYLIVYYFFTRKG